MAIDPLEAARQRAIRTGRSYFPAANRRAPQGSLDSLRGAGYDPNLSLYPNTTNSYGALPTKYGYGGSAAVLAPQDNPAYQAAILRPRPALQTIRLPSGGTTTVPASSVASVYNIPAIRAGFDQNEIQGRLSYPQNYALGYGSTAPPPITAAQRVQSGQGGFGDFASVLNQNLFGGGTPGYNAAAIAQNPMSIFTKPLGTLGSNLARWFGGSGNTPSSFGGTSAAGAVPNPTPTPPPIPTATPFKTASERGDLMNDINGTFYGGGHAPVPTPTPTPYQAPNMAYSEPRRYFDPYGYA